MKDLKHVLKSVRQSSPKLYAIAVFHVILAVVCVIGLLVDDRTLMGINVWIKPLKFCISGAIFITTVGYLTSVYPYSNRKKNVINNLVSWTLLVEILIIVGQAARGIQSHYNTSNALDGILFAMMGILIGVNVFVMVWLMFDAIRLKMPFGSSIKWAIVLGWAVVIFGSWVGGQMIGQMAHNVGVVDGGEGLPLLNWSTVAGDLRVAHFFGLHGIQIIPLFALVLSRKWKVSEQQRLAVVIVFGLIYTAFIGYTFWQAKQAMPFLSI